MNRLTPIILVLTLSVAVFGQSGRKIAQTQPQTDATPVDVPLTDNIKSKQTIEQEKGGYSESKSQPRRLSVDRPSLRNTPQSTSDQNGSKTQSTEVLGDSEDDVVKVETNLITIPVTVLDRNGLYIPDLEKHNFKIFEDGLEQQIEYFATTETPVTVALLIDTSPSTAFKIEEIQAAAIAFVNQLKAQDSVIVIEFDGNPHVLAERTTDRAKIFKAIRKADFGNGTALYDAVHVAVARQLANVEGRKAIVLFTDGVDTFSRNTYERTVDEAEEFDATIFPIYYNTYLQNQGIGGGGPMQSPIPNIGGMGSRPRGTRPEDYARGRAYLRELADYTGGRVYNADNNAVSLTRAFESIAEELRRQYSIGYIPQTTGTTGQRKAIRVRVNRPNLVIRARDSYIVGQADPMTPKAPK